MCAKVGPICSSNTNIINIGLLNARSLRNKVVDITDSLTSKNISICAITETWLSATDDVVLREYNEMGYDLFHQPRTTGKGGGVGIIVQKGLDARKNKCCSYNSFELIELTLICHAQNYLLSSFYRTGILNLLTKETFLQDMEKYVSTKILSQDHVILWEI